jgi:antitoxin Phd
MNTWQLQEAKAHLSEVVRLCVQQGPQILTVRGKEEAVMLSKKDFQNLTAPKQNFFDFMQKSPLKGLDLTFERDKSKIRDIKL